MNSRTYEAYEAGLRESGLFDAVHVGFEHPTRAASDGSYFIDVRQTLAKADESATGLHVCIWAAANFVVPALFCGLATVGIRQQSEFVVSVHDVSGLSPEDLYDPRDRRSYRGFDLTRAPEVMQRRYYLRAKGRSGGWGADVNLAKQWTAAELGRRLVAAIGRDLVAVLRKGRTELPRPPDG